MRTYEVTIRVKAEDFSMVTMKVNRIAWSLKGEIVSIVEKVRE